MTRQDSDPKVVFANPDGVEIFKPGAVAFIGLGPSYLPVCSNDDKGQLRPPCPSRFVQERVQIVSIPFDFGLSDPNVQVQSTAGTWRGWIYYRWLYPVVPPNTLLLFAGSLYADAITKTAIGSVERAHVVTSTDQTAARIRVTFSASTSRSFDFGKHYPVLEGWVDREDLSTKNGMPLRNWRAR